jgi:hypothetical protein
MANEITLTAPWQVHEDAARILMRLYPDQDSLQELSDVLDADNAAVIAVRNAGRAYLSAVQAMKETETLLTQWQKTGTATYAGQFEQVGIAFLQFIDEKREEGKRAIEIFLPRRDGGAFSMPNGIRDSTPLGLLLKALKPKR